MLGYLKRFKIYFAFILAVTVISFNGSFDSNDIDYLEAQKFISSEALYTIPLALQNDSRVQFSTGNVITSGAFFLPAQFSLVDTFTINANPGPANNGGSTGWAMFLDLIAGPRNIDVTQMSTASTAPASGSFSVEIFTRSGTALGGPASGGPGSSTAGWTSIGNASVVQGLTGNGVSLVFNIPTISVPAEDTVGVAIKFTGAGPRYVGTGSPPYSVYADTNLTLITGDGRSAPFTPTGSWFASRALTGVIRYVLGPPLGIGSLGTGIPEGFILAQNYPNPFNPATKIEFAIPNNEFVSMKVHDMTGKEVSTLVNKDLNAGYYSVDFDASHLSSGVYLYSIKAGEYYAVKRMVLVK